MFILATMVDDDVINSKVGKPIRLDATFPVNKTFTDLACKNSLYTFSD